MGDSLIRMDAAKRDTPRWLVIWWWITAPWVIGTTARYVWDQTITRWRTGADPEPFASWGDDIRTFLFPLIKLLVIAWMAVAAFYLVRSLVRRRMIPWGVVAGIALPALAFQLSSMNRSAWQPLLLRTLGPGKLVGTLLAEAARQGDTLAIAHLLRNGASVEAFDYSPDGSDYAGGETALMTAAGQHQRVSVIFLLNHGADPNHGNTWNETPLMRAVASDDTGMVRLLLAHGANPAASTTYEGSARQNSVMSIARYTRDSAVIRMLR